MYQARKFAGYATILFLLKYNAMDCEQPMSQADRFVALTRKVNSTLHQIISILMREIIVTFEISSSIFPLPTQFPLQSYL